MKNTAQIQMIGVVVVGLVVCSGTHPAGSNEPPESPPAKQNMVTKFQGTLKSFHRGVLLVTRDDGREVTVQPPEDRSAFEFTATAKPAFLRRGTRIRFQGTFNQAGVPMAPVKEVTIFEPITGKVPANRRRDYIPGVYPQRGEVNRLPPGVANCSVTGGVLALDPSGLMIVQAGNRPPVRIQLSPDATFVIRFNTLSLAQEGDRVDVAGFYEPPDDTRVRADRVTITTDRVYGAPNESFTERAPGESAERANDTVQPEVAVETDSEKPAEPEQTGASANDDLPE